MEKALIIAVSFLAGSVPFGWLYVRLAVKKDIRSFGSGNTGATNVYRICGLAAAALVFSLDFLKGFLPVFFIKEALWLRILAGIAVVAGHNFSLFLKGRGGKGVASASGAAAALAPLIFSVSLAVFIAVFAASRIISVSSLAGCMMFFASAFVLREPPEIKAFAAAVFVVILFSHRKNIGRLLTGKERKIEREK